jgi:hypothetical protein
MDTTDPGTVATDATVTVQTGPSTTSPGTPDSVSGLPNWAIVVLLALVAGIIVAMFVLTMYNMSAPRSTLKNLLGIKGRGILRRKTEETPIDALAKQGIDTKSIVSQRILTTLSLSAQVNTRTTRTTLAIAGFALLGVAVVVVFAITGQGVRDLRTQVVAGLVTLVASIAGFYFGSQTATDKQDGGATGKPKDVAVAAPTLAADGDQRHLTFTVGVETSYQPVVGGYPVPTLALIGKLPDGLTFDRPTGKISGAPTGDTGDFPLQLIATNGISPDQTLSFTLTVVPKATGGDGAPAG